MTRVFIVLLAICSAVALNGQPPLSVTEAQSIQIAWAKSPRNANTNIEIRRGFNLTASPQLIEHVMTDSTGMVRMNTKQWEPIEIHLPRLVTADHIGCLMVKSTCRPLPEGSSLDRKKSVFYWHVPNAYKGDFDLVFFQAGGLVAIVRVTAGSDVVSNLRAGGK